MNILRFDELNEKKNLLLEQGSGDLPACTCSKKKKKSVKRGLKKMQWTSKFMGEGKKEPKIYERCGVCGGIRKKKVRKPIKLHID